MKNEYNSVQEFFAHHRLLEPRRRTGYEQVQWRLADMSQGEFRACPSMRGTAMATDGVLLIIEAQDGKTMTGHLMNWLPDAIDAQLPAWQKRALENTAVQKQFSTKLDQRIERALADLMC
jgi:hypothetical protein